MRGLYIHVPFCRSKCPYCDFYSLPVEDPSPCGTARLDAYTAALTGRIRLLDEAFETVYFGGGTPALLGAERLCGILETVRLAPGAEITLEANPGAIHHSLFSALKNGGFNRLSLGLQSANPAELRSLGRSHSPADAVAAVRMAQAAGFENISLDLMAGIPGQTAESLSASIRFCVDLGVQHISCYLLKLEEGTAFYQQRESLALPEEDVVCALYLQMVRELESLGYAQYEISNFAKPGMESRHNLKYWRCEEYAGLGPSAHSFLNGTRAYFPRDLDYFLAGGAPIPDGPGGDQEEKIMLRLRLAEGLRRGEFPDLFDQMEKRAQTLPRQLVRLSPDCIALRPEGFLVSNSIIATLLA